MVATHGLSFQAYRTLFTNPLFISSIAVTIWVTLVSTAILLAISWLLALYVRFSNGILSRIISTVYVVPMFIPTVIASYAIVTFWSSGGELQALFQHLGLGHLPMPGYTDFGIVLGLVWTNIPFAVILLASGLFNISDAYIEAGRDLGASWGTLFRKIILPLNRLPTIIVIVFTVTGILGSYAIPDIMGPAAPQMLAVTMTNFFTAFDEPQQSQVMAVLLFLAALLMSALYVWGNRVELKRTGGSK